MARTKRIDGQSRPTDGELEILRVLWAIGPASVRRIHERIATEKSTTFNTTLKLLQIMFEKGLVTRRDEKRPHVYEAALPEAQMQQRLVRDLLDRAFGGAARKLVAALTATDLSRQERAAIRKLLAEHDRKTRPAARRDDAGRRDNGEKHDERSE